MSCPKCNQPMTCGAPHGPWPVQWECRRCNEYIPVSEAAIAEGRRTNAAWWDVLAGLPETRK